jgi:hypothetical protein
MWFFIVKLEGFEPDSWIVANGYQDEDMMV